MTGSKGPDKNGVTAAPSAEMEDSLRASMALKTDQLWQLKCRCNVCAQEEPRWATGWWSLWGRCHGQESLSQGTVPALHMAHWPVFGSLCVSSPDRNETIFLGEIPMSLPTTTSKLGPLKETLEPRKSWQFTNWIQFGWGTFKMSQRKLRKISTGLQGSEWGKQPYPFK